MPFAPKLRHIAMGVAMKVECAEPNAGSQHMPILIVEDDAALRDALCTLLQVNGFPVLAFENGGALLDLQQWPEQACILLDLNLPDISGLEVLSLIRQRHSKVPVIMMTAKGQIKTAVEAMKLGALDFLEKPLEEAVLLTQLEKAHQRYLALSGCNVGIRLLLSRLTTREREILACLAEGLTSKEVGQRLAISPRTVDVHRANILAKLEVKTVAAAVQLHVKQTVGQQGTDLQFQ
ncbi:two-component system response regulator FixJ [Chitinivorax tropicus]|uniref:Two-component system response regulator FixJ n=1 Tax=Chitinivorax tropicus TaxID=714531 RepID=A0A840MLZ8_9PROT|nr:response regulator [Chitinivorax tropicus]MBB5017223.1 two-component system response regulator FixJ [Chitinivorax tropicus]